MTGKIIRPPSSNPADPAILVPEAINPERELLAMPCKIVRPLVPEAINLERVISYVMQNRSSNPAYPVMLVSTLRELLVMPCKIVRPPSSNRRY